jgi:2-oxoglutarate ferredoxin oxidoreductase subunit alpha
MVHLRAAKVAGIAGDIPALEVDDQEGAGLLVLGWGSTYGPIGAAVQRVRGQGLKVAQAHLRHLNPFPANTGEVLGRYDRVLVPEMNLGQLRMLVRSEFLVDAVGYNRVRGLPLKAEELEHAIVEILEGADRS